MKKVPVKNFKIGEGEPLAFICGPCVIESEEQTLKAAEFLKKLFSKHHVNFIFKSSYDKANRLSLGSYRGPGLEKGLRILEKVQKEFDLPVVTDVHSPEEALVAGNVCDMIQIPAFLCRQTDLVVAAAKTKAAIQLKKGQFMAPWDMKNIVNKIVESGNDKLIIVDRGTSFGYNNLVSDMRAIPIMQGFGFPVCFDATHSVQLPGGQGGTSGGQREFVPVLAKAAVAVGANAIFMEAHAEPEKAKSDSGSMMRFEEMDTLVSILEQLYAVVNRK